MTVTLAKLPRPKSTTHDKISLRRVPAWTQSEIFMVKDKAYGILRFPEGKGPDQRQTIRIASNMKAEGFERLTFHEAEEVINDEESNSAFMGRLKEGEWGYVRSGTDSAGTSHKAKHPIAYFGHVRFDRPRFGFSNKLCAYEECPDGEQPARVVLLRFKPNPGQVITLGENKQ